MTKRFYSVLIFSKSSMLEITSITPSELIISSAPNSTAFSKKSSSSTPLLGKLILPFRSKFQDTHPDSPRFPPNFEKSSSNL